MATTGNWVKTGRGVALLFCVVATLAVTAGCGSPEKLPQRPESAEAPPPDAISDATDPAPSPQRNVGGGGGNQAANDLLNQIERGQEQQRGEAQYYVAQGNKFFNEADYRKAEELFRKALDLDPTLRDAKEKLVNCLMFQGKRDGEIRSVVEQFSEEIEVGKEQRLTEARRLVERGRASLDEGNVDSAIRDLGRARELLLWFDYGSLDTSQLADDASGLFDAAIQRQRELKDAADEKRMADARDEAERLEREADQRKRDRVERLIRRVVESMQAREYVSVKDITERILSIDPRNRTAQRFHRKALDMIKAQRYISYLEANKENTLRSGEALDTATIPYDVEFRFPENRDYWTNQVMRREASLDTADVEDSFAVAQIKTTLATQPASFDFEDQPLSEVVSFLRQISGLNITIDPDIDAEEKKVDLKLQGVRLQEALNLILKNTGLDYTFRENTLYITEKGKAFGSLVFDIYNVTDILNKIKDFPGPVIQVKSSDDSDDSSSPFDFGGDDEEDSGPIDPEELAELIKESTGGEELWDESNSKINPHKGQLLITATQELHISVKSFLENLRKDSDLFVIVEARFIDMVDDFLEDIGVDVRGLGQPPGSGFGTAYGTLNSSRTGGNDIGFSTLGNPTNPSLLMGQDRVAGRIQHVLDGFVGAAAGTRLTSALRGLTLQVTWLDPYQINAILRATQETRVARSVTAPRVTASNGQRVNVSVITQRSYVQDYELVSGGTGLVVQEVADPVIATFQDGVILDVQPVISSDRKYITIDVRPTLANLVNGIISTVTISLGSLTAAATQVDIDLPEITLQQAYTSVTVPDGGTVLLGGFRALNERKYESFVPFVGRLPIIKNIFRRKAYLREKRSLYILLTAKVIDLRAEEKAIFN